MNLFRTAIIGCLFTLAPAAASAGTDCTGIQDRLVTPVLFHRCLAAHTHGGAPPSWQAPYPVPGLADAPLRLIDLKPVHFAFDKAQLSDEAKGTLGRIAAYLQHQKGLTRVLVIGYADHTGSGAYNYDLSVKRTRAVAAYLAAQGVAPGLLHGESHGNRMPVDESWTPSGRKRNRRVELYAVVR